MDTHCRHPLGWLPRLLVRELGDFSVREVNANSSQRDPLAAVEVGREIREARMRLGLSIGAISAALRIRRAHLEALESGAWSDLPSRVHQVGYARAYAAKVGLGAIPSTARTDVVVVQPPAIRSPMVGAKRGSPAALLAAAGLLLVYLVVNQAGHRQSGAAEVPDVPARLVVVAEASAAREVVRPADLVEVSDNRSSGEDFRAIASRPQSSAQSVSRGAAILDPVLSNRVALQAGAGSGDGVWVRVRVAHSQEVIVNRVLRPGEIWRVPPRDGLVLDTGKAQELRVLVDGMSVSDGQDMRGVKRGVVIADLLPGELRSASVDARPVLQTASVRIR